MSAIYLNKIKIAQIPYHEVLNPYLLQGNDALKFTLVYPKKSKAIKDGNF